MIVYSNVKSQEKITMATKKQRDIVQSKEQNKTQETNPKETNIELLHRD